MRFALINGVGGVRRYLIMLDTEARGVNTLPRRINIAVSTNIQHLIPLRLLISHAFLLEMKVCKLVQSAYLLDGKLAPDNRLYRTFSSTADIVLNARLGEGAVVMSIPVVSWPPDQGRRY
jgi:hypothetical protein